MANSPNQKLVTESHKKQPNWQKVAKCGNNLWQNPNGKVTQAKNIHQMPGKLD